MNIEKLAGYLSGRTKMQNVDLLAKDAYLQGLLIELSGDDHFRKSFVFKGGTCLTKAYFGYYRFSEDLDFSWIDQKRWEKKTGKEIRRLLSKEIDGVMEVISKASEKLGLDFKAQKHNKRYVELGASNRLATFKLWYRPAGKPEGFIKIQINFVEVFFHKFKEKELKPIYETNPALIVGSPVKSERMTPKRLGRPDEIQVLFPEEAYLTYKIPKMSVYDLKEIASEKVRAVLTRRGMKARDIIDLYILSEHGVSIKSVRTEAIEKIRAMLKYEKYSENMLAKADVIGAVDVEKERYLLVTDIGADFWSFSETASNELKEILQELIKR